MFQPEEATFPQTAEQILEILEILSSFGVPTEIGSSILDYAEYWLPQKFISDIPVDLTAGGWSYYALNSALYLQTGPIGYGGGFDTIPYAKSRKVQFRLISCSKFGDMDELNGTYEGTDMSFFEVSIFREDKSWTDPRMEPVLSLDQEAWPQFEEPSYIHSVDAPKAYVIHYDHRDVLPLWLYRNRSESETKLVHGFEVVPNNNDKPMWWLQSNRVCWTEMMEHIIEWKDEFIEGTDEPNRRINGSGVGRNFIASLCRGDRIAVWAKANVSHNSNWLNP
jgi:hypothetical protein